MTISSGARLGPYEVLAPLGAGGMGEVYRARDTRLGREVAIKVLPAELASDSERLRRFEKEARSASSLNHPSIVTIYDIGSEDSVSFIAMELVDGSTLRQLLASGPFPAKRTLKIAPQIAEGLAKAHEAGIVHRDLKPENVMVTKDGLVKILDFGLAKLTSTGSGSGEGSQLPTMTGTTPGVVVGTVGYMSPEQVNGEPVDFRSDQFALGSMLYEMATGKRAFQRKTAVDTLAAILNDEPEPIAAINPQAPPPLRWIIERCLAKDPRERYASTEDLARDLAGVAGRLSEVSGSTEPVPRRAARRGRKFFVWMSAAGLIALGLVAGGLRWRHPQATVPRLHQLTFRRGVTGAARFAPDGQTIVYSASWEGKPQELFSTRSDSSESRSLGLSADILSISSKAELAILLPDDTLAQVPLAGGAPRELLEGVAAADWARDGSGLAVIHRVGEKVRLEYPIGKVLVEETGNLSSPRFSPKGDRIAYLASSHGASERSLCVVDLSGKKRVLAEGLTGSDLGWAPAGDEIWVNAPELFDGATELRAIRFDGRSRSIARLPGSIRLHDVSSDGRLLVEHVWFRTEIQGFSSGGGEVPLAWLDGSEAIGLSADGKTLLINEWARGAVYVRGTDGRPAVRLGEGSARALSPDGKWALISRASPSRLVLLPTGPGQPREYPLGEIRMWRAGNASFTPDASRVVLVGNEPGERKRSYLLDLASGAVRPITPPGTSGLLISPDGGSLLTQGADGIFTLQGIEPNAGGPGRAVKGLLPDDLLIGWATNGRNVFVIRAEGLTTKAFSVDSATGERKALRDFRPVDPAGVLGPGRLLVTPDARVWINQYWRDLSDLYVVDITP
jgi:eukaryotic-like serine/threonine-protein kinase